jgi:hypothetical protein
MMGYSSYKLKSMKDETFIGPTDQVAPQEKAERQTALLQYGKKKRRIACKRRQAAHELRRH